jgi:hypothetical protein
VNHIEEPFFKLGGGVGIQPPGEAENQDIVLLSLGYFHVEITFQMRPAAARGAGLSAGSVF